MKNLLLLCIYFRLFQIRRKLVCVVTAWSGVYIGLAQPPSTKEASITIDPIILEPCRVIRRIENITLPESLGGMDYVGFAVVKVYLDSNCNILDIEVLKLSLKSVSCHEKRIDFMEAKNMSEDAEVCRYLSFIEFCIRKELVLDRSAHDTDNSTKIMRFGINGG